MAIGKSNGRSTFPVATLPIATFPITTHAIATHSIAIKKGSPANMLTSLIDLNGVEEYAYNLSTHPPTTIDHTVLRAVEEDRSAAEVFGVGRR